MAIAKILKKKEFSKTSICMATHNGEKYIKSQLKSIINQTIKPNEIIIYDDASSDKTLEILYSFIKKYKVDIKIIKGHYQIGVVNSFSKAISAAKNEIIFLSDQDDIWMNNKIEKISKSFKEDDQLDLIFTNGETINHNDSLLKKDLFQFTRFNFLKRIDFLNNTKSNIIKYPHSALGMSMAFKKRNLDFILPMNCNDSFMTHDKWILLSINFFGGKIKYLNEKLVKYRLHMLQESRLIREKLLKKIYKDKSYYLKGQIESYEAILKNQKISINRKNELVKNLLIEKIKFYKLRLKIIKNKNFFIIFNLNNIKSYFYFSSGFLSFLKDLASFPN